MNHTCPVHGSETCNFANEVTEREVTRIGIDLDTRWKFLLDYVFYNACVFGTVTIKDSPSGNGWHIKVKLKKPVTFPKSFEIRGLLRDDHHRLAQDEERYRLGLTSSIDILFDTKRKRAKAKDLHR